MSEAAVYIRNATKSFDQYNQVLNDFSMTVPKGSIYGLLGASGCGKTTLLNCIVGRKILDSGDLWVLGGIPGTVGSGVPGPSVGYMPQDVALCPEFTVEDAVYYFGKLMGMTVKMIQTRFEELKQLLDLPPDSRYLRDCSGGQQRRVSLASALIHSPELLILDEPTAGVDPLLRDRIWRFLRRITAEEKTTVIITTHYIEETRSADMIGLMRKGKLIAEAPPNTLLHSFHAETLEEVFLMLSRTQERERSDSVKSKSLENSDVGSNNLGLAYHIPPELLQISAPIPSSASGKEFKKQSALAMNKDRIRALMDKNWKQFYRNVSGWVFILVVMPICCATLFLSVVGVGLTDVRIAVVNEDSFCEGINLKSLVESMEDGSCRMESLSCRYLDHLDKDPFFIKIPLGSLEEAVDGIRKGKYIAALFLPKNHTLATEQRLLLGQKADDDLIDLSEVKVYMDMSDFVTGSAVKLNLVMLYQKYLREVFEDCHYQNYIDRTIHFEFFYGDLKLELTENMVPGYFLTLTSYIATMLTSQIIISERLGGVWDRSAVAGVTAVEIILTHFVLQFCVLVLQLLEMYVVTFILFGVPMVGSLWVAGLMAILEGISGMCYGFLVSIITYDNYFAANILISGGFYPMIMICGIFWPLEGQPQVLRWIANVSPFALPAESFRYVMKKGWDLSNHLVLRGVGVELGWIAFLTIMSVYLLKNKQ